MTAWESRFLHQFSDHIKFNYTCFDRVIIRGYIRSLFFEAGIVLFLRAMGFRKLTNGVMRIFTDQLNAHIKKYVDKHAIPMLWWPSVDGGRGQWRQAQVCRKTLCRQL